MKSFSLEGGGKIRATWPVEEVLDTSFLESEEKPKMVRTMYQFGMNVLTDETYTQTQRDFAKKYLEAFKEVKRERSELDYENHLDEKLSSEVAAVVMPFVKESPISVQREILKVSPENEKPFQVKVVRPKNWGSLSDMKKEEWWKKHTGGPAQFVSREEGFPSTMYLSADDAEKLLHPERFEDPQDVISVNKMFQHEYRHTQRKMCPSSGELFRFIDEPCTNVGASYIHQKAVLGFLGLTTDTFKFKDIMDAYELGDDEGMADVLKTIQKEVGDMGLMLIGSERSSYHGAPHGIVDVPMVEITVAKKDKEESKQTRFFETLLAERNKKDPNWPDIFSRNLSLAVRDNEWEYETLELFLTYILYPYMKYSNEKETPNVYRMEKIIEAELEKLKK